MPRSGDTDASLTRVIHAIDAFFPSGTPIAGQTFLDGVTAALGGDEAALVLVRMSDHSRVLRVVDDLLHKAPGHRERAFTEKVNDHAVWIDDPIARRLHDRCKRRPSAHFAYTTRRLARNLDVQDSFSLEFLDGMGVRHEITSLMPVTRRLFSLLTVYRMSADARPFTRNERRVLKLLHRVFTPRIVDLRFAAIRESLPITLRDTFILLLAGKGEREIARSSHRSPNTIHDHVKRIYQHFGVTSRAQLMARFIDVNRVLDIIPISRTVSPDEA